MKIESAGGIVFRKKGQKIDILLIRDRFGYWTFPKGKKEPGETTEVTALREIMEETQLSGKIVQPLISTVYRYHEDGQEIEKTVTYYLVQYQEGSERPQMEEIHQVNWFSMEKAEALLQASGYQNNVPVFQKAKETLNQLFSGESKSSDWERET